MGSVVVTLTPLFISLCAGEKLVLPGQHGLEAGVIGVVPTQEMQQSMAG